MSLLPNIFIAAGYKTGSTHIGLSLHRILRIKQASVVATRGSIGDEEQRIDIPAANTLFPLGGFIFQNHVRASQSNLPTLLEHEIRPVVVTRNMLDSLVSIRDRFNLVSGDDSRTNPTTSWRTLPTNQQWRWLVYNVTPWMMAFYTSWFKAEIPKLFVSYEDHFKDQTKSIRLILEHTGFNSLGYVSDADIAICTDHKDGNHSGSGISGRGAREIPMKFQYIVRDQAKSWETKLHGRLEKMI